MFCKALFVAGAFAASAGATIGASAPVLLERDVTGPVIDQDFPDPGLIRIANGTWYAYSTSSGGKNIPMAVSTDFDTWSIIGDALPHPGDWIDPSKSGIWAPDVREINDTRYVMYYTGKPTANAHHCVAAATAASATGPFTAPSAPFICDDAGGGVIDISGFQAPDGQRYVVWKVDGSAINSNSTPIRLQRVQADGVTLEGEVYTLINRDASDGPLVEAPSLVFWDGWYYLFHSSHLYSTTQYDIRYAVSQNVTGPYTKAQTPFLQTGNDSLTAPGGATVINVLNQYVNMVFHGDLNGKNISGGRAMWTAPRICLNNGVASVSC